MLKEEEETVSYSHVIWISVKTPVLLAASAQEYQSSYLSDLLYLN
jgi:hypothetical protein